MPNPKSPPETALVIGGGVVGLATALTLQARGIATILVDPGDRAGPASWGNAGHIATEQVEPLASANAIRSAPRRLFMRGGALALPPASITAWLPFALRMIGASRPSRFAAGKAALGGALAHALGAWRQLLSLAQAPELLREEGHFVVWETPAGARSGQAAWAQADTGTASFRAASEGELDRIGALTAVRPVAGLRFTGSAQIADLPTLADALTDSFVRAGGRKRLASVERLDVTDGIACARLPDGAVLTANAVIVCAGVASGALLRPLGHRVPIIAERGYHLQAPAPAWPADLPPIAFEERSLIVTRFRGGLRAASFVELSAPGRPPDPRKWARLRDHAQALRLPFDGPMTQWTGTRPTLPDYLPAIGRSRRAANLFYAFGHQHLGLTLAAATAEAMAALVLEERPPFDLAAFTLDRFGAR